MQWSWTPSYITFNRNIEENKSGQSGASKYFAEVHRTTKVPLSYPD